MLNIKNAEAHGLAKELAELTHQSLTGAVTQALRSAVEAEKRRQGDEGMAEDLLAIARQCAPHFPEGMTSTNIGDYIYDENGMP